jgi:hypothetical protein
MNKFIYIIFLLFIFIFSCKSTKTKLVEGSGSKSKSEINLDTCNTYVISKQLVKSSPSNDTQHAQKDVVGNDVIAGSTEPDYLPRKLNNIYSKKIEFNKKNYSNNLDSNSININRGLVAYSVPLNMKIGKEYIIKVRITKQKDKTVLIVGDNQIPISDDTTNVRVESIRVSSVMSASLYGKKSDFDIESTSTEFQNIEDFGYTEWSWLVTPLKKGQNNLKLNIKIRIQDNGQDFYKDITVFEKKIKVKSDITSNIVDFIQQNWEWFMSVIFIPMIRWLFLWNKKRKKEKKDV